MSGHAADRNLLFGVFALQMDFLTRDQLVEGMQAWVLEKSRPLEDILVEKGLLAAGDRDLLLPLIARHVEQHDGDPEKSLKALSSVTPSVTLLKQIDDADLQHSLAGLRLPTPSPDGDFPSTISFRPHADEGEMRYVSLRSLAKGGLGEVFIARDLELDREVALKEIQLRHAHDPQSRLRFLMEAEITGKLEHPGIVPVYGLGSYSDGRPFYAMRLIRGDSLHEAIQAFHARQTVGNPFESVDFRKLLGRFMDVCNAVGYAHSRGVLHRDLKPGNVMLGKYGETLVVDWGLAKIQGRREPSTNDESTLQISSGSGSDQSLPGSAIGTPGYMSPEQAEGKLELLGPATDIYGLGAILYCLLSSRKPIESQAVHENLRQTIQGTFPKPRDINPLIPKPLEAICLKAMALSPSSRYSTCEALADDVECWLADKSVSAYRESLSVQVARFARRHRAAVQAAAAAIFLIAVVATISAFLIEQQRQIASQLAQDKSTLAEEKSELAAKESFARHEAERHERSARRELAWNFFVHGLAEYDAGRFELSLADFGRAWVVCPPEDPRRKGYWQVLMDRATRQGTSLGFSLAHESAVKAVAFRPDGEQVVTVNFGSARLWDAWTGAPVGQPMEQRGHLTSVAFSPDGERVVIGSEDHMAQQWDVRTCTQFGEPLLHADRVFAVAFSPDGENIVTGSGHEGGEARLWNARTGMPLGQPMRHDGKVNAVAFSPNGEWVLTGSDDKTAQLWDARTGAANGQPMRHGDAVLTVAFSPDGRRIMTGCLEDSTAQGEARFWDVRTHTPIGKPLIHENDVTSVALSPDGRWVLTASDDGIAQLWDAETGIPVGEPIKHEGGFPPAVFGPADGGIAAVAFSPDGGRIITGSEDRTARLWHTRAQPLLAEPMRHQGTVTAVAFHPDGKTILTGSSDKTAQLWDAQKGVRIGEPLLHEDLVSVVAFSPNGETMVTGSGDIDTSQGIVRLWNTRTRASLCEPMRHDGYISSLAFSPNGKMVATGSLDDTARVWDARTGAPLTNPMDQDKVDVQAIAFSPEGERVFIGNWFVTAQVWDVKTGTALDGGLSEQPTNLYAMAFSPQREKIILGFGDGTAQLWDLQSDTPWGEPMRHDGYISSLAFSPDGARVVIGSYDDQARVWDVATNATLGNIP